MGFLLVTILTVVINSFLGAFVYFRNPQNSQNKAFLLLIISLVGWIITLFLYYSISEPNSLLFIGRLNFAFTYPIGIFFYRFILLFPTYSPRPGRVLNYIIGIFSVIMTLVALLTPFVDKEEIAHGSDRTVVYGDLWPIFIMGFISILIFGIAILIIKIRRLAGVRRTQLILLLLGFLLLLISGIITNVLLPSFGIFSFQQLGPLSTIFFVGFTSYAIVKHKLMNLRFVLIKSVAYSLLISIIIIIYTVAIYWIAHSVFNSDIQAPSIIVSAVITIAIAFSFNPIKEFLTRKTERLFYKKSYSSHQLLSALSTVLATNFGVEDLATQTLKEIMGEIKISKGAFYVYSKDNELFAPYAIGYKDLELLDKETARFLLESEKSLIAQEDEDEGELKKALVGHDIFILSILKIQGNPTGILVFSEKLTGQAYTEEDIEVIEIFSSELAIALENAKAYEEIRQFNITLESKVEKATKELRSANEHLMEVDRMKDEFVSLASHELRTPMTAVNGFVDMMLDGNYGKVSGELKEPLSYIAQSTQRLIELVNDMLNISRIEAGRMEFSLEQIAIKDVCDEVVKTLLPVAKEKHIDLRSEVKIDDKVQGDSNKTKQILNNLIGNSLKFTQKGSITLTCEKKKDLISVFVSDTGSGIDSKDHEKLFGKFNQINSQKEGKIQGTGLGLYLSRAIIRKMGGDIWLEKSELGRGSVFAFSLPLTDTEKARAVKSEIESAQSDAVKEVKSVK